MKRRNQRVPVSALWREPMIEVEVKLLTGCHFQILTVP